MEKYGIFNFLNNFENNKDKNIKTNKIIKLGRFLFHSSLEKSKSFIFIKDYN